LHADEAICLPLAKALIANTDLDCSLKAVAHGTTKITLSRCCHVLQQLPANARDLADEVALVDLGTCQWFLRPDHSSGCWFESNRVL
jgi:hypothetical protein